MAALQQAAAQEDGNAAPALEALRASAQGAFEPFLLDALALVTEGKVARYSAMISEAAQAAEARLGQLALQCDQVAEALAFTVDSGTLARTGRCRLFTRHPARAGPGARGSSTPSCACCPPGESGILDELLADPDPARREQYLNALGAREDDALTPFFMKAMQDPIVEVGQLAIHHLGKLPSSFPALMALFRRGNPDQIRMAIWAFKENRTRKAAGAPAGIPPGRRPRLPPGGGGGRHRRHRLPGQRAGPAGAAARRQAAQPPAGPGPGPQAAGHARRPPWACWPGPPR